MEGERFDDLIRSTLRGVERRGIVRAGLGSLAVAVMTAIGLGGAEESEAKKKKKKKKKHSPPPVSPPASPPLPPSPPPPPPPTPVCKHVQEACSGNCCNGLTCSDNFCAGDPPVCCGDIGAPCTEPCDCCGQFSTCGAGGTCECAGLVCGSVCTGGECCANTDCPGGQICDGGACVCSSGFNCGDDCCQTGSEVCKEDFVNPPVCQSGTCPTTDYCTDPNLYECNEGCACATSINGVNVCSSFAGAEDCVNCTSDDQCGAGKVCIPQDDTFCQACTGNTGFCVPNSCLSSAGMSAASSTLSSILGGKRAAQHSSKGQTQQGNQRHHSPAKRRSANKERGHRRR